MEKERLFKNQITELLRKLENEYTYYQQMQKQYGISVPNGLIYYISELQKIVFTLNDIDEKGILTMENINECLNNRYNVLMKYCSRKTSNIRPRKFEFRLNLVKSLQDYYKNL